ncbi:sine oculis-like transcription factor [Elysia marginata]|uniref:Sine oculis-like transcription factor n=1 Tax=Elysia marginata TaxID=1093978 RepID=A0AAV4F1W6_9GAST|nr:sine oculis-like transcription factor [Elysia marginata]
MERDFTLDPYPDLSRPNTSDYLEHLSWCWRFLHICGTGICHLHVMVGSNMAHLLAKERQFTRLRQFVSSFSVDEYAILYGDEKFNRAMIRLLVEESNYVDALCLLKNGRFYEKDESLLQTWYEIHYKLTELSKGRQLNSLDKYRVRKRQPPPASIWPENKQPRSLRAADTVVTSVLRSWFHEHLERPYPSRDDLAELARQTQLSSQQIRMWFANARRKKLKCQRKGRPTGRATSRATARSTTGL